MLIRCCIVFLFTVCVSLALVQAGDADDSVQYFEKRFDLCWPSTAGHVTARMSGRRVFGLTAVQHYVAAAS